MDFNSGEEELGHQIGITSTSNNKGKTLFSSPSSSSPSFTATPPPPQVGPNWLSGRDEAAGASNTNIVVEKEHMFDKVVTPSDVGKLNRLVIPKLHAERFFPLDSSTNDKGLLLNFEDRIGKMWRFRYSYWNSSQSYVMTKGWSRFVKEKKLDAGDVVSFQRGAGDSCKDRLYIDWRRRPHEAHHHELSFSQQQYYAPHHHMGFHRIPLLMRPPLQLSSAINISHQLGESSVNFNNGGSNVNYAHPPPGYNYNTSIGSLYYLRSPHQQQRLQQIGMIDWQQHVQQQQYQPMVFESVPVVQVKGAATTAKKLRLFGVNMDCPISNQDDDLILSSNAISSSYTIYHHQHHEVPISTLDAGMEVSPSNSMPSHNLQLSLSPMELESELELQPPPREFLNRSGKSSMSFDLDI